MTKGKMITDLKTRILPLFRRSTSGSSTRSTTSSLHTAGDAFKSRSKSSLISKAKPSSLAPPVSEEELQEHSADPPSPPLPTTLSTFESQSVEHQPTYSESPKSISRSKVNTNPQLRVQEPTPVLGIQPNPTEQQTAGSGEHAQRPDGPQRQQSLALNSQERFLKTLLDPGTTSQSQDKPQDYFAAAPALNANMLHRKIWVKRPGASPTLVLINEDDLVDDVRDMILRKYSNSLGRSFDSPDITLRIVARNHSHPRHSHGERVLGPEEPITRALDSYYPGGQTVDEALVIDVPSRRTPRHSPRYDNRPLETGGDYFPIMPVAVNPSPRLVSGGGGGSSSSIHQPHSIAILNASHVPPLPSPGATSRSSRHRPKFIRTNTSSPTIIATAGSHGDTRPAHVPPPPAAPPLPTPPAPAAVPQKNATPPPRPSSPRPTKTKRAKKDAQVRRSGPSSLLDGAVPPINVLIVEDNIINLKLLEAFMKRLKVRWHTAMNGRDAVSKWRDGGFHLVLMDIQLPIMNGLDATKEIRRLEKVNGVGVLADKIGTPGNAGRESESTGEHQVGPEESDRLKNGEMFKIPVIIVALTASSLQSDRHEALAAGCNDFLTKPVNFVWLERKVMEWGCMQALIDFEGWRKWKNFSQSADKQQPPSNPISVLASVQKAKAPSSVTSTSNKSSSTSTASQTPIPPTLAALNAQSNSVDSIESVSTTHSNVSNLSEETATADATDMAQQARHVLPRTSADPATASAISPHTISSDRAQQRSPTTTGAAHKPPSPRLAAKASAVDGSPKGSTPVANKAAQEETRRKRSSLGHHHGSLSGVVEEMEDGKGVDVGA